MQCNVTCSKGLGKVLICVGDNLFVNLCTSAVCRMLFASLKRAQPLGMHVETSQGQPDHPLSDEPLSGAHYKDTIL